MIPKCFKTYGNVFIYLISLVVIRCGIYTFSGSTLPSHLKTVDIPLFTNKSLQSGIAEEITDQLTKRIQSDNLLKPVSQSSDVTIIGSVLSYKNHPYTYGSEGIRDVEVTNYSVTLAVEIEFLDNKKDKVLYAKKTYTEDGIYDFRTETVQIGQQRAIEKIINQILQNSVQSW